MWHIPMFTNQHSVPSTLRPLTVTYNLSNRTDTKHSFNCPQWKWKSCATSIRTSNRNHPQKQKSINPKNFFTCCGDKWLGQNSDNFASWIFPELMLIHNRTHLHEHIINIKQLDQLRLNDNVSSQWLTNHNRAH